MPEASAPSRYRRIAGAVLAASLAGSAAPAAEQPVSQRLAADPHGTVEVINVAGSVDLSGWAQPEVEVTGSADEDVDRVEVTASGSLITVRAVPRMQSAWRRGGDAHLVIHVPAESAVSVTLVSADLKIAGLRGEVKLQTVNGDVSGEVGGSLRASTVSGNVRLAASAANRLEIKTISGRVALDGGGGDVDVTSVNGNVTAKLAVLEHGRFKSISGNIEAALGLAPQAVLDGESVSGNLSFKFPVPPDAAFEVQSFTGRIDNCFGPRPEEARYGPGSRWTFKSGEGRAQVHLDTKSGNVRLCTADGSPREVAACGASCATRMP